MYLYRYRNIMYYFPGACPVYESEAAQDMYRDPAKLGFDDCAPNTQPNGLKFGEYIVHIW